MSRSAETLPGLPGQAHLDSIQRWTQLFCAVVVVLTLGISGPRGQLGAVVGGLLMVGNAALLCALGRRAGAAIAARRAQLATGAGNGVLVLLLLLFNLKLLILAVLIYLCIRLLPIDPLAFLFGLSTLPAAILARAVQHGFSGKVEPSEPTSTLVAESDRLAKD